ncbi:MAG: 3-methyladenine glycosylase/8-oxoguanine glycosylase-like protein [Glaciihabitans sp.]|jgi:DNA-3-methyladenine glycosylase II|nr:3-methyladenine glycosylase/8-oxoguanine glycosylase-like protein [Glaciihabitans sp.]
MTEFTITPDGAFSLEAAAGFGFGPNMGRPVAEGVRMRLAFVTDDFQSQAYVALNQNDDGIVAGTIESDAAPDAVVAQVKRILSLDHSGEEWASVGEKDPVLGGMQRDHPGLRPVLFHSPYEAAAWSIISARRQRSQGVIVRNRISAAFGRTYGEGANAMLAFPTPERLLELREVQSLDATKVERLHAVARAALDGQLNPAELLSVSTEEALDRIQKLPGIGPMYSTLILLRSTGATDVITGMEPRIAGYLGHFYGLGGPATSQQIAAILDGWHPFRTWGTVLTRVAGDSLGLVLPATPPFADRRRR